MHLHARRARRLALALAVPIVAVGAITLSANTATSATMAVVQPTDQPDGGNTDGGGGGGTDTDTTAPDTGGATSGAPTTTNTSPGTSPTTTRSATPTPTTKSPTPSPSRTAGGGGGGAGGVCGRPTTGPSTVKVGTVNGKQALVDNNGCTLYLNTNDTADTSACDTQCAVTWWPLLAPGQAGSGVQQPNLSSFTRSGGVNQVTYFTHQLYRYSGDTAPGDAKGQGQQQIWYLIDPSGNPITS